MQTLEYTLSDIQDDFILSNKRQVAIIGAKGSGKAQPITEPVLTPSGYAVMGSLSVGSRVVGVDGKPKKVWGIYPQGEKDVYKITMTDGSSTRATADHLWTVQTGSMKHRGNKFKTLTTKQIMGDLRTTQGYAKWYVPMCAPVQFERSQTLIIPPYSLGAILGDGGMTGTGVVLSSADEEIVNRVSKETGTTATKMSKYDHYLNGGGGRTNKGYGYSQLTSDLRELDLMGRKSDDKFIPEEYLYASVDDRIELLRGLMDTDGCDTGCGTGSFCTTSEVMAGQFVFLCRSLGLSTQKRIKRNKDGYLDSWRININAPFNPFWVERKASKFNIAATQGRVRGIYSIEHEGTEECRCISVEDNHYLTSDFIVTHNTFSGARFVCVQIIEQPDSQGLVMFNTLQQARDIYYQDIEPLLVELNWPYHFNGQTMTLTVLGSRIHLRSAEADSIKNIESVQYEWGWADEASFFDFESLKTFVSRIRLGKAMIRITSMPDEPDHPMYEFLERSGYELYEISLYDNPDREFADRYADFLKSIYTGPQLKRYLTGERVSLAGLGLFSIDPSMKEDMRINASEDLFLFWDFNVVYRAVTVWQRIGTHPQLLLPVIGCVASHQMQESTVHEDAKWLADKYGKHPANIYLGGDASENKRSSQTTESIWMTVRRAFKEEEVPVRSVVRPSNPNVKDTIQCCNWALIQGLVKFETKEKNAYRSVSACKADKFGEVDKSSDDKPTGAKTHEADTFRYALWHFYKKHYPGGKKKYWVV